MKFVSTLAVLGMAAVALGGAAQASEVQIVIRAGEAGWQRPVADYGFENAGPRVEEHRYGGRRSYHEDRLYERPVVERHRWSHPVLARPVFARPGWHDGEECRIIVKRRVNHWGELVVRRIKICE